MSTSSTCASCGKGDAEHREVTRTFGSGAKLLVIEEIPMVSCPHCGESYFAAETVHEIERIKTLRLAVATLRPIPVATYRRRSA